MRPNKKTKYILIFSSVIVFISSCGNSDPEGGIDPISVNIDNVRKEKITFYNSYPGTIVALNQVELRGEVSGYLTGIYVKDGQQVYAGQKLYEIEQDRYQANLDQAKAKVQIARDNLEKTQQDADRYTKLSEEDAIAKQRLDYALTDLQNAKSQLISAQAELEIAKVDYKNSVITAPFTGTIGISQVKLGALITPGQTLLNIISSNSPIGVDFIINENELRRYEQLLSKKISANDSLFRIVLPDNSTYPYNGTLSFIDRAVDPQTGTIRVRLIFPNESITLKPGMNCTVNVLNENGEKSVIPYKAVMEQMSEYFIFQVHGNKVNQIKIEQGPRIGKYVVINEGLKQGDTIVVDGIQKLHNGALIETESKKPIQKKSSS